MTDNFSKKLHIYLSCTSAVLLSLLLDEEGEFVYDNYAVLTATISRLLRIYLH